MAYIVADRIKETTIVTGTGTATLLGAVSGYRSFASVMLSIGDTCAYAIVNANASEWEVGIGTYSAVNTLTRTTVQASTNSNAVVNFSAGTKDVFLGPTAGSIPGFNPITNTITSGTWSGNTIDVARGGTGATTAAAARTNLGAGTVTSVAATGGTGISVTGSPITGAGTLGITNTAPDQTVSITAGTGISATGTYPNFTVTNTAPSLGGTVTSVSGTGTVNGLTLTGTVTTSGNLTLGGTLSNVDLTSQITGTLPVANGGTGVTTSTGSGSVVLSTAPTLTTATFAAGTISASTPNTITQTWNNAAVAFSGLTMNVTDVASNASSLLADLQVGSVSQFQVDKSGAIAIAHNAGVKKLLGLTAATGSASTGIYAYGSVGSAFAYHAAGSFGWGGGSTGMIVNSNLDGAFMWATTANDGNPTLRLYRDANDTLAQRRSTNAQTFRLYNTYTDANNYERLGITWASNICTIGLAQAGTGLPRTLNVNANALNAPALPVAATVTAATGNGTTVTYTCASTFAIGQVVSITGLTTTSLNLSNQTITGVTTTTFTVSNATVGTAAATQAGTATIQSAGNSLTLTAGSGSGVGAGGNIILQPGAQGSSGGNGKIRINDTAGVDTGFNFTRGYAGYPTLDQSRLYLRAATDNNQVIEFRTDTGASTISMGPTGAQVTLGGNNTNYVGIKERSNSGTLAVISSSGSVGGSLSFVSSTTAIATNTNDLALPASAFQRLNCTTACSLTGIAPVTGTGSVHVDGRMIRIYNVGAYNLTLSHNSASSTTGNKFFNATGADIILATNDYAELIYDSTNNGSGNAGWRVA